MQACSAVAFLWSARLGDSGGERARGGTHVLLVKEGSADGKTAVGEALTRDNGVVSLVRRLCLYRGRDGDCLRKRREDQQGIGAGEAEEELT
jgi:hypothetical protein